MPIATGSVPIKRRHGGHHDGAEAHQRRLIDRVIRLDLVSPRSRCSAKSIIMMAFFFTMPISMIMPTKA